MPNTVLILSVPGDKHAFAVSEALRLKGAQVFHWYPADFPSRSHETFRFVSGSCDFSVRTGQEEIRYLMPSAIWYRRVGSNSDFGSLNSADHAFSRAQRQAFREGSLQAAFPHAFWVNPPATARLADNKLYQQSVALQVGMPTPDTLFSNSPTEIRRFIRDNGGRIAFKSFPAPAWQSASGVYSCHTVYLGESDLVGDDLLSSTPGIFQAIVPKAYEVRLTMLGSFPLAVKILSQETKAGKVDWRLAYDELRMEPYEVPKQLVSLCSELMAKLSLVFGCFDFIVTPEGEHVFLEVNQQGQFLFLENYTGIPFLDAFSEFLIQGSRDFRWPVASYSIRYSDLSAQAQILAETSLSEHAVSPFPAVNE